MSDTPVPSKDVSVAPCPFCGATNVSVVEGDTFRWRIAQCNECEAQAPVVRIQTMGEGTPAQWEEKARLDAIAEWNKRHTHEPPAVPNEELELIKCLAVRIARDLSHCADLLPDDSFIPRAEFRERLKGYNQRLGNSREYVHELHYQIRRLDAQVAALQSAQPPGARQSSHDFPPPWHGKRVYIVPVDLQNGGEPSTEAVFRACGITFWIDDTTPPTKCGDAR